MLFLKFGTSNVYKEHLWLHMCARYEFSIKSAWDVCTMLKGSTPVGTKSIGKQIEVVAIQLLKEYREKKTIREKVISKQDISASLELAAQAHHAKLTQQHSEKRVIR